MVFLPKKKKKKSGYSYIFRSNFSLKIYQSGHPTVRNGVARQVPNCRRDLRRMVHTPLLRIQSAVAMKLSFSRTRRSVGTPVSPMAWSMQATH